MDECQAASLAAGIHAQSHGGPLKIFFYKLCKILSSPAVAVFVYDGARRPSFKRGVKVNTLRESWWSDLSKRMIQDFGFHWHQVHMIILFYL